VSFWKKIVIALICSIVFGWKLKYIAIHLELIAILFINSIKMVSVPLIFFSILNGISNVGDVDTLNRLGTRALIMYISTTMFAVTIGIIFANIFTPGKGFNKPILTRDNHEKYKSIKSILLNIVPPNPIKAMSDGKILQIVLYSFFTGFALISIGEDGNDIRKIISSITKLLFKMIQIVVSLTPYGIFSIMSWIVAKYEIKIIIHLANFTYVVILALFVQYLFFGLILLIFRINPLPFYIKILDVQMLALLTSSSKATLSKAINDLIEKMGVSKKTASFVLPLGAAINMDATAIYLGACSVFFAQMFSIELSINDYLMLIITSTFGSIGAAGFPGGSMIMMGMVLSSIGLPLDAMGMVLGLDRILEMIRTMINITGDCVVTIIIDIIENKFNREIYYSK